MSRQKTRRRPLALTTGGPWLCGCEPCWSFFVEQHRPQPEPTVVDDESGVPASFWEATQEGEQDAQH